MGLDLAKTVWKFNEAVSLLRDARSRLPAGELADEIDEGMPDIMNALREAGDALPDLR